MTDEEILFVKSNIVPQFSNYFIGIMDVVISYGIWKYGPYLYSRKFIMIDDIYYEYNNYKNNNFYGIIEGNVNLKLQNLDYKNIIIIPQLEEIYWKGRYIPLHDNKLMEHCISNNIGYFNSTTSWKLVVVLKNKKDIAKSKLYFDYIYEYSPEQIEKG